MTTTTVSLRLSVKTLSNIQRLATQEGLTVTDYILSKADPTYSQNNNILQVSDILFKMEDLPQGHTFSLKSLYDKETWISFSSGSRISTGRLFYQSYDKGLYGLRDKIEFIGKNSANLAQYKKI